MRNDLLTAFSQLFAGGNVQCRWRLCGHAPNTKSGGGTTRLADHAGVHRPHHHRGNDPGPIAVNSATFVGLRIAQIPGAIIATLGCITPALFFVSLLSYIYRKYKDISLLQSVLSCLRPVIVALIFGAGLSILSMVVFGDNLKVIRNVDWIGVVGFATAFFALRKLKWNPILTMCLCGVAGLGLHVLAEI